MQPENLCSGCDLCCRKYKIYLFPKEAKAISTKMKINYKKFVQNYLDFYFELFSICPGGKSENNVVPFSTVKIGNKEFYLFATLALKQKNNSCIFLKNKECTVYSARPLICRMFPNFKFYGEEFPFCKLDNKNKEKISGDPRKFYPFLQKYLQNLQKEGMKKVWKFLPEINEKNVFVVEDGKKKKNVAEDVKVIMQSVL